MRNVALALTLVGLSGCYGSFSLTKNIWELNGAVSDSIVVQEVVFIVLVVVPVYPVAAAVDAILLNTIEAFTGSNPVTSNGLGPQESRVVTLDDGRTLFVIPDGRAVRLEFVQRDGRRTVQTLRRVRGGMELVDETGARVALARVGEGGTMEVVDGDDVLLRVFDRHEVAEARTAAAHGGAVALAEFGAARSSRLAP